MNLKKLKNKLNQEAYIVFEKLGMKCEVFSDNIYSTCPVHESSDNPRAFSFSTKKCMWKCWTRDCQAEYKNDIFGLIIGALSLQAGRKLEFSDALRWICKEFQINNLTFNSPSISIEDDCEFSSIVKQIAKPKQIIIDKPIDYDFNHTSISHYFNGRGFKKSTLKYFGVLDCFDSGVMKERAIIPIHNDNGDAVVAIIGRSINEYRQPKFLFYPTGFNKRYYLYNYHRAKKRASETSCLYILEGQGDVWRMKEAGVLNCVSIFGKTISKEQKEKIMKLPVTHLIVLMDNDQAGREARIQIKRDFYRSFKISFPKLEDKDIGDMTIEKIKKQILENLKGTY